MEKHKKDNDVFFMTNINFCITKSDYICSVKNLFAIPLILIMLVKPLWPLAEYVINYDYIVTNLCENKSRPELQCDGKCYLSKMLAEENGQQEDNPFESHQSNNELVQLVYYSSKYGFEIFELNTTDDKDISSFLNEIYSSRYLKNPTPPPKVFV